jgi:hypothetical protein
MSNSPTTPRSSRKPIAMWTVEDMAARAANHWTDAENEGRCADDDILVFLRRASYLACEDNQHALGALFDLWADLMPWSMWATSEDDVDGSGHVATVASAVATITELADRLPSDTNGPALCRAVSTALRLFASDDESDEDEGDN